MLGKITLPRWTDLEVGTDGNGLVTIEWTGKAESFALSPDAAEALIALLHESAMRAREEAANAAPS